MRDAQYVILNDVLGLPLVIKDIGPWDQYQTITNDAERVVRELVRQGKLPPGRRLFYHDSDTIAKHPDEILVVNGKFAGFRIHTDIPPIPA